MDSIIIKHTSEFDQSKLGQCLDETMIKCLKDTISVNDKTGTQLATLLEINHLSREFVMTLTQPWYRANMLATWCRERNLPVEKVRIKDIIKTIKHLKKLMTIHKPENALLLMLFLKSTEPNIDNLLFNLDELLSFFESFVAIDFKNGNEYSANFLKKYALDSLFWIGKKMGLAETGKPTQLNQYIHIVTGRTYAEINKDYLKYNKADFSGVNQQKMNVLLVFIYNPYCNKTNNILSAINKQLTIP